MYGLGGWVFFGPGWCWEQDGIGWWTGVLSWLSLVAFCFFSTLCLPTYALSQTKILTCPIDSRHHCMWREWRCFIPQTLHVIREEKEVKTQGLEEYIISQAPSQFEGFMFSRSLSRLSALASSSILSMPRSLSARCKKFTSTTIFRIRDHDKRNLHSDIVCTLRIEVRIHLMLLCHAGILFNQY